MHLRYGSVNKKIHKILIKKYLKIHSVKLRFFFKLIKPFWRRFFSFLAKKITLKTKIFFYSIQISRYKIKKKLSIFRSNFIAKKFNKKKICQRNKIGKYKKKADQILSLIRRITRIRRMVHKTLPLHHQIRRHTKRRNRNNAHEHESNQHILQISLD